MSASTKRQLVAHRRKAVVLDESQGDRPAVVVLTRQEDPLVGDEDVVEDRDRLHHLALGAEGMVVLVLDATTVGARHQLHPGSVHRDGEGDRVVSIRFRHRPRGDDDQFVDVRRAARVDLRPPDDDAVGAALDDAGVVVRVGLVGRSFGAVTLGVGLGHRDRQVVVAAVLVEGLHAAGVLGLVLLVNQAADLVEGEEAVGADLLHQWHQRLPPRRARFNEAGALQEVIGVARDLEVAGVRFTLIGDDGEVPVGRLFGHLEVDGGVLDGLADDRVSGDVADFLATVVDRPVVLQALHVFRCCAQAHAWCSSGG